MTSQDIDTDAKDFIYKRNTDSISKIEHQISNIELRQQELQGYITTIQTAVNAIEQQISVEERKSSPNYQQIHSWRGAIFKNIELISKLYDTYKEFENVKIRCQKEINDSSYKTFHLVEVSIKQLDHKFDNLKDTNIITVLMELQRLIKTDDNQVVENVEKELNSDPNYEL